MSDWRSLLPSSRTPCPFPQLQLTASKQGQLLDAFSLCNAEGCVVVGRKDCDVLLEHPSISRKHAAFFFAGDKVMLVDLKSAHGTFVDGQQLEPYEPVEITENSKITFGGSTRVYQITGKDTAAPSSMGPPVGVPSASRAKPVPPVPVFHKQQQHQEQSTAKAEARQRDDSTSKDEEGEGDEGRRQSRERRQAEIAAIMQEMTSSTPTWKPHTGKRRPLAQDASIISDDVDEGAVFVSPDEVGGMQNRKEDDEDDDDEDEGDDDDEDEDDDDFGPRPPSASERAEAEESAGAGATESSDPLDAFALSKQIPVSHSVELTGHSKSVLCISYEPAGNRVVTGSMDYMVKMYDFGGMDRRHAPFREARPEDGHPVIAVSHSPSGDRFIAAPHSNQPVVYDREGAFLIKFVSGDMYLRDQVKTKGHTKPVTGARWHPTERETMLTCALDGTLRIWDLGGETTFKMLINTTVIKTRNARGLTSRATCCAYGPEGSTLVAGTEDGMIQIWQRRKAYSRADTMLTPPGLSPIRWVEYSPDGSVLASRAENGIVHLWDVRQTSRPFKTFADLHNIHETANVCFSPDGEMCVVATSPETRESGKSNLVWLPVKDASEEPCMKISVADAPYSAIAVKWHPTIKQVFCTMGSMSSKSSSLGTRVYYDPRFSVKGATRTAGRAPPRQKDPTDFAVVGEIITPHALPMFREESSLRRKKKGGKDKVDPTKARAPAQPPKEGPGSSMNTSFFFTQYVMSGRKKDTSGEEDPREALLRYAKKAKEDPIFVGKAYANTQPELLLESRTLEQEREEQEQQRRRII